MKRHGFRRWLWLGKKVVLLIPDPAPVVKKETENGFPFKIVGLASVAVGVAALGLFIGREFRIRYKFNRQTPYERFAHSGEDGAAVGEFGMGI